MENRIGQIVADWQHVKFLTLTLAHTGKPLKDEVDRLLKSFALLRRRKVWKDRVNRGIYVIEITANIDGTGWHPHLHAIMESKFLDSGWLSAEWKSITGDSYIVQVQAAKKDPQRYLSKYVSKTANDNLNGNQLWELHYATCGRRLFGKWGDVPPLNEQTEEDTFTPICTMAELMEAAHNGETWALSLAEELHQRYKKTDPPEKSASLPP